MLTDYEYFLKILPPEYTADRPQTLWRRSGSDAWEYLSPLDWTWHEVPARAVDPPPFDKLVPVDAARAQELAADRQLWVRYWALEAESPPYGSGEPYTVIRVRSYPGGDREEAFGRENVWIRSTALDEYHSGGSIKPPRAIDRDEAEEILQRIRGVSGATDL